VGATRFAGDGCLAVCEFPARVVGESALALSLVKNGEGFDRTVRKRTRSAGSGESISPTASVPPPVRISLVDLVYGAVIGIALERFDASGTWMDWARWGFAFLVVSLDWVYVHRKYWEWDYKNNGVFVLDMMILFFMSRLFSPSASYWLWMALIFSCYSIWDYLARKFALLTAKEFRFSLCVDLVSMVIFLAVYLLTARSIIASRPVINLVLMAVYGVAVVFWYYGSESPSERRLGA
jgi:hypothetical protein